MITSHTTLSPALSVAVARACPAAPSRPRARRGFTLMELLVVMVVLGILAGVALVRLSHARARALTATLQSDLRNLAVAEEAYYYQHGSYTQDISLLAVHASPGVTMSVAEAGAGGWSGTAVHPSADRTTCAIFYGSPSLRPAPAAVEGEIACQ